MTDVERLARFLCGKDGIDPDAKAVRDHPPHETKAGRLRVLNPWEETLVAAWTFYKPLAEEVLAFVTQQGLKR